MLVSIISSAQATLATNDQSTIRMLRGADLWGGEAVFLYEPYLGNEELCVSSQMRLAVKKPLADFRRNPRGGIRGPGGRVVLYREIRSILQWVRAPHHAVRVALQLSCYEGSVIGLFGPGLQVSRLSQLGVCISCSSELPLSSGLHVQCGGYAKCEHMCVRYLLDHPATWGPEGYGGSSATAKATAVFYLYPVLDRL